MALRATEAFSVDDRGVVRIFTPGTLVHEKDPVVKGREHLFEKVEVAIRRAAEIEQTTAAPGQRRRLSKGRGNGARRAAADSTAGTEDDDKDDQDADETLDESQDGQPGEDGQPAEDEQPGEDDAAADDAAGTSGQDDA